MFEAGVYVGVCVRVLVWLRDATVGKRGLRFCHTGVVAVLHEARHRRRHANAPRLGGGLLALGVAADGKRRSRSRLPCKYLAFA